MIRVLHLLGHDADLQSRESSRVLRDASAAAGMDEVASRTIGRGGKYASLLWAVLGLRREVAGFDVVHAWDEPSLAAAVFAGARRIVFTAAPLLRPRTLSRLRSVMRFRDVRIVCTTAAQHRAYLARGLPVDHCLLIRPPVEVPPHDVQARAEMRRQLGLRDDDFVMLAAGESTRAAAHERAVWTGSILHVTDERYRVLLWGRGPRLDIAAGLGRKLRQTGLAMVAERVLRRSVNFPELLPAADAMLVAARGPAPTLPVAMAMAAHVPVVAVERPEWGELLVNGETALTVPDFAPRLLAQRVLDLRADRPAAEALAARARRRTADLFPVRPYVLAHRTLYDQLAPTSTATTRVDAGVAATPAART